MSAKKVYRVTWDATKEYKPQTYFKVKIAGISATSTHCKLVKKGFMLSLYHTLFQQKQEIEISKIPNKKIWNHTGDVTNLVWIYFILCCQCPFKTIHILVKWSNTWNLHWCKGSNTISVVFRFVDDSFVNRHTWGTIGTSSGWQFLLQWTRFSAANR